MITSIDKETIDFLAKKKLTFNQFCMCLLVHYKDVASIIKYTNEVGFLTGGTVIKPNKKQVNELDDLVERGFIEYTFRRKDDKHHLDNYSVTEKFTKGFLDGFKEKIKQVWDMYPTYMIINNEEKPYGKSDFEAFSDQYTKLLKEDVSVHEKIVIDLTERLKQSKYAAVKLSNYISTRLWETKLDAKPQVRIY